MFEIDKGKFGAFVAELRREKGYTQKEVARRLFLSDKAVSKWETGASIPDTALLIPLAELLGVSVTELLLCRKNQSEAPMDAGEVEGLVKTAIQYSADNVPRAYQTKSRWTAVYVLSLLLGALCAVWSGRAGLATDTLWCGLLLGGGFGAYFVFFVQMKLPAYYDENSVNVFSDGPVRMNIPGVTFNNRNWPKIVDACRFGTCLITAGLPALCLLMGRLAPLWWTRAEGPVCLILILGGFFLPIYWAGKRG